MSDKVGESRTEILKRLCYSDGTILRAANPALPSLACILKDPRETGYLKLVNAVHGVGYLAVFAFGGKCTGADCSLEDLNDSPYRLYPENPAVRQYAVYDWIEHRGFESEQIDDRTIRFMIRKKYYPDLTKAPKL